MNAARFWREEGEDLILELWVQPGARADAVAGPHGGALRLRIAATPTEGRANAALQRFLAGAFGVAPSAVTVLRGHGARRKTVRIQRPARRPDWLAGARSAG